MSGQQALVVALACAWLLVSHGAMAGTGEPDAAPAAGGSNIYQNVRFGVCSSGQCIVTFPKVPSGKVLQTTNLSCQAESGGNGVPATSATLEADKILSFVVLVPYQFNSTFALSTGTLSAAVFIGDSKPPKITIGNSVDATCTLSGRLVAE